MYYTLNGDRPSVPLPPSLHFFFWALQQVQGGGNMRKVLQKLHILHSSILYVYLRMGKTKAPVHLIIGASCAGVCDRLPFSRHLLMTVRVVVSRRLFFYFCTGYFFYASNKTFLLN